MTLGVLGLPYKKKSSGVINMFGRNDYVGTNYWLVAVWIVIMVVLLIGVYNAAKGNPD